MSVSIICNVQMEKSPSSFLPSLVLQLIAISYPLLPQDQDISFMVSVMSNPISLDRKVPSNANVIELVLQHTGLLIGNKPADTAVTDPAASVASVPEASSSLSNEVGPIPPPNPAETATPIVFANKPSPVPPSKAAPAFVPSIHPLQAA